MRTLTVNLQTGQRENLGQQGHRANKIKERYKIVKKIILFIRVHINNGKQNSRSLKNIYGEDSATFSVKHYILSVD